MLTVDESTGSLAALRALSAAGYPVWAAVSRTHTYAERSRAATGVIRLPNEQQDVPLYLEELAGAVRRVGATVLLPGTESTLQAITGNEAQFPAGVAVGTSPAAALARATDKAALPQLAQSAGLQAPVTKPLENAGELPFPLIAKPRHSVTLASDRLLRQDKAQTLLMPAAWRDLLNRTEGEEWVAQPRLERGRLLAICGVAWHGELVSAVHQVSDRTWPLDAGTSALARTVAPDREREEGVRRLLGELKWSGIYGMQFVECDGEAWAIDLNPRVYGSIALAIAAGHNLLDEWTRLLLGERPSPSPYRVGVRLRLEDKDVRALAVSLARGRWREGLGGMLPRRHTAHAIFAKRDPAPALGLMHEMLDAARGRVGRAGSERA
jgi:predicted ATP-grasp superfamily ATP-dependent carboligase